jgi:hypothetical protein
MLISILYIYIYIYIHTRRSGSWGGEQLEGSSLTFYRPVLCVEVVNNFPWRDIPSYGIQLYFMKLYSSSRSSFSIFFIFIQAASESKGRVWSLHPGVPLVWFKPPALQYRGFWQRNFRCNSRTICIIVTLVHRHGPTRRQVWIERCWK